MLWTQRALRRGRVWGRSIVYVNHGIALGLAIAIKINKGSGWKASEALDGIAGYLLGKLIQTER